MIVCLPHFAVSCPQNETAFNLEQVSIKSFENHPGAYTCHLNVGDVLR